MTPVARELRLQLHASPFVAATPCDAPRDDPQRCRGEPLRGDGEFYRGRSIFPVPGYTLQSRGGVVLFKLDPLELPKGQHPVPGLRTTFGMQVESAAGDTLQAHYTVDLPILRGEAEPDVYQSSNTRKAVALYHYTEFTRQLLRNRRGGARLRQDIAVFKAWFEAAAKELDDDEMAREVALWHDLVELKKTDLKRNQSSCCTLM